MENGKIETADPVQEPPGPSDSPAAIQTTEDADGTTDTKMTLKEPKHTDETAASAFLNGTNETGAADETLNGESPVEERMDQQNGIQGNGEKDEMLEEEVDAEGYRIDERRETETVSHTEEIKELRERTEVRTHEVKEVTLEEVRSKETTRPLSLEEFEAMLSAQLDKKDEVEIGRDIVIEQYTRVESEHEEMSGGKVTVLTFSVKEEHTTEEIKEQMHFAGKDGSEENADMGNELAADDAKDAAGDHVELGPVENGETKTEDQVEPSITDVLQKIEDAVEKLGEEAAAAESATGTVEDKIKEDKDKGDKDKGSKSKGIINYIKVKARSLSRDRHRSYAVAAVAANQESGQNSKKEEEAKEGEKTPRKGKQKKWKLFGKKSGEHHDETSSEEGVSGEENDGEPVEKSATERKKFKLNLFGKKTEEQKGGEEQVNGDAQVGSPVEPGNEDEKPSKTKVGKKKKVPTATLR